MGIIQTGYRYLPSPLRSVCDRVYGTVQSRRASTVERKRFIDAFFESDEYERYITEFESASVRSVRDDAQRQFEQETPRGVTFGDVRTDIGKELYALIRAEKPATVVETGVCNGFSTLCILAALRENGTGHLYSIDYPFRADESLAEFRSETFAEYGGAAIPADRQPGWIVPESLTNRWSLRVGKSQRELPELLTTLADIDFFVHDSEHSLPCMAFEFELAWEWLREGGVLVADDVTWNDAFEEFVTHRATEWGYVAPTVGYARKR